MDDRLRYLLLCLTLSAITLAYCLLFYPPITERLKRLATHQRPVEDKDRFSPPKEKFFAGLLGLLFFLMGLAFYLEFLITGRINYSFKAVFIEVVDPVGANVMCLGIMIFGAGSAGKHFRQIQQDYKKWKMR